MLKSPKLLSSGRSSKSSFLPSSEIDEWIHAPHTHCWEISCSHGISSPRWPSLRGPTFSQRTLLSANGLSQLPPPSPPPWTWIPTSGVGLIRLGFALNFHVINLPSSSGEARCNSSWSRTRVERASKLSPFERPLPWRSKDKAHVGMVRGGQAF